MSWLGKSSSECEAGLQNQIDKRLKWASRVMGNYLAGFGEGFSIPYFGPFMENQVWMNFPLYT